jgi:hypothetical protein
MRALSMFQASGLGSMFGTTGASSIVTGGDFVAVSSLDRLKEHVKEVREHAHREPDPLLKARLHQIANDLEEAVTEIERHLERRS